MNFEDLTDQEFDDLVAIEVRDNATFDFMAWLREPEQLVDWLYSLRMLHRKVEGHIRRGRDRMQELKPAYGEQPSGEYLSELRVFNAAHKSRVRFLAAVDMRLEEVKRLINQEGIVDNGEYVDTLVRLGALLDDFEYEAARKVVTAALDRLSDRAGAMA